MDLFSIAQVMEFAKMEPGHGALQSVLLFMIWWSSRGLRKELLTVKDAIASAKMLIDERFNKLEGRIIILETTIRGK